MWYIYVDGASRGNPGEAGAGVFIKKGSQNKFKEGFYLGKMTNNQAEYWALLIALAVFLEKFNDATPVVIRSDSQLLINQLKGLYRVKHDGLQVLYQCVKKFLDKLTSYEVEHVYREQNTIADGLANDGVDSKNPISDDIKKFILKS